MKIKLSRLVHFFLISAFLVSSLYIPRGEAQMVLPKAGILVGLSPAFTPSIIRGMTIDPKNPFALNFIIDPGNEHVPADQQKTYYQKMVKYFLGAMTVAEDKQWVNLSPYEKNRIIDPDFGKTTMGRELLAEDYMLKQITSSLIYPEGETGKRFWKRIYAEAAQKYGTTNIPVNTFNKVWITPESASIYEKDNSVLIVDSKLKVMLEEDYLSLRHHVALQEAPGSDVNADLNALGSRVVREIIIPTLTREVNEGKNFAQLRQIFHGMILATWYKRALRQSILSEIYANKNKVRGVDLAHPLLAQQAVYKQYLKAFKKGVYNYIKEEADPMTGEIIPRKYFSGGFSNFAMASKLHSVGIDAAMRVYGGKKNSLMVASVVLASASASSAVSSLSRPHQAMRASELPSEGGEILSDRILRLASVQYATNFHLYNDLQRLKVVKVDNYKQWEGLVAEAMKFGGGARPYALSHLQRLTENALVRPWSDAQIKEFLNPELILNTVNQMAKNRRKVLPFGTKVVDWEAAVNAIIKKVEDNDAAMSIKRIALVAGAAGLITAGGSAAIAQSNGQTLPSADKVIAALGAKVVPSTNADIARQVKAIIDSHFLDLKKGEFAKDITFVRGDTKASAVVAGTEEAGDDLVTLVDIGPDAPVTIKVDKRVTFVAGPQGNVSEVVLEGAGGIIELPADGSNLKITPTIVKNTTANPIAATVSPTNHAQGLSYNDIKTAASKLVGPFSVEAKGNGEINVFYTAAGQKKIIVNADEIVGVINFNLSASGEFIVNTLNGVIKFGKADIDQALKRPAAEDDADQAMRTPFGGIDLNSVNLDLKIKRDGAGVPLPLGEQDAAMLNAPGFFPIVVDIHPAANLPILSQLKTLAQ